MTSGIALGRASIQRHSKSFALAARLLPAETRNDASVVYAWCRAADDAIDESRGDVQSQALADLQRDLAAIYSGAEPRDALLASFREVTRRRAIPFDYPAELLLGMEMDARGQRYESFDELLLYRHRVASTVGLMMCPCARGEPPGCSAARGPPRRRHAAHQHLSGRARGLAARPPLLAP